MNEGALYSLIILEPRDTTLARNQLLSSLYDDEYRRAFVQERIRASISLQIRALREQRKMTQRELGDALGMAQTWISRLEDPEYGKMTVATLLRLANAFDTDLEIKFRPFSRTVDTLTSQGPQYFCVPAFHEEFGEISTLSDVSGDASGECVSIDSIWRRRKGPHSASESTLQELSGAALKPEETVRSGTVRLEAQQAVMRSIDVAA